MGRTNRKGNMVKNNHYRPHCGDIINLSFDPQAGHEQKGYRPALVISNDTLNQHSTMAFVCPITNTNRKHPFHIELNEQTKTTGVILCDQAKMLDVDARQAKFIEKAPQGIVADVVGLVKHFMP